MSACGGGSNFTLQHNILIDDNSAHDDNPSIADDSSTDLLPNAPKAVRDAFAAALAAAFDQQSGNLPASVIAGYHAPFSQTIAAGLTFTVGETSYDILQITDGDDGATIYTVQSPRGILQHKCEAADWCVGFTVNPGQMEMVMITAPGAMFGEMAPRWQTTTGRRCMIPQGGGSEICQREIGFNERSLPPGDEDDYDQNSPLGEAVHRQVWTCNGDACEVDAPAEMDDDMDGDNGDGGDMDTAAPETAPADFTAVVSGAGASGQVALSWTATEGASGYKIYRNDELIATITDGAMTSYTDNPGIGAYAYTIAAYNSVGDSPQTTAQTANIGKAVGVSAPMADAVIEVADIETDYLNPVRDGVSPSGANNDLRAGEEQASVPIVVDEYTDANDAAVINVQRLSYAHLGLWLVDNTFDDDNDGNGWQTGGGDTDDDGLEIVYHLLNDNRIVGRANLPTSGTARYNIEADVVYKEERFYPDSGLVSPALVFTANFGNGTVEMRRLALESDTEAERLNYLGGETLGSEVAPADGGAFQTGSRLFLTFRNGVINADGSFSGDVFGNSASGFFADLQPRDSANADTAGGFSGAFFDAADYDHSTDGNPAEIGGVFSLEDSNGEMLTGGFLGAKR